MGTGEAWKRERESRGMTLDDATAVLHVSKKYLIGIEEGDFTGWPERVFSSGYIRAYAKLLSQDPEPVLSEYYSQIEKQSARGGDSTVESEWQERERQKGARRTVFTLAAAGVLLLGLLLAWYGSRTTSPPAPTPSPAPERKTGSPPVAVPAVPTENAATVAPGGGTDNVRATVGPSTAPAPGAPAPAPRSSVASVGGLGPVKSSYQLFLEAAELTWMMYTLDDGQPIEVMLYPGDKISIQAGRSILLKMGNAGGVAGTLNGKPLPPFGEKGQVKEFRIGN